MNKHRKIFLIVTALLVGSFLGTYFRKRSDMPVGSALSVARALIDTAGGDQTKLAQASDLLRQEIAQDKENLTALFLQGRALQQRGLVDQALKSYDQYLTQRISIDFAVQFNSGELSELRGDLARAEAAFAECTRIAPGEANAWEKLINILIKQGRNADAKERFRALLQILPSSDAVKRLSLKIK